MTKEYTCEHCDNPKEVTDDEGVIVIHACPCQENAPREVQEEHVQEQPNPSSNHKRTSEHR